MGKNLGGVDVRGEWQNPISMPPERNDSDREGSTVVLLLLRRFDRMLVYNRPKWRVLSRIQMNQEMNKEMIT